MMADSHVKDARNLDKVWTTWQSFFQVLLSLRVPHHMLYNATVLQRIGNTLPPCTMHSFDRVAMATCIAFRYIYFVSNVSRRRMHEFARNMNKAHNGIAKHAPHYIVEIPACCYFRFCPVSQKPGHALSAKDLLWKAMIKLSQAQGRRTPYIDTYVILHNITCIAHILCKTSLSHVYA